MSERPLILFGNPSTAEKARRYGGPSKFGMPNHKRQVDRLEVQFSALQNNINRGGTFFQNYATNIEPEYTLVFETVGDPQNFYTAVKHLKVEYPAIEWLMELSDDSMENTDDFYAIGSNEERDDSKRLTTKLFCIMSDKAALGQMMSLWQNYAADENYAFPRGLAGFREVFKHLKDIHKWGIQERVEDTGLLSAWEEDLKDPDIGYVKAQIELFFRSNDQKRKDLEIGISQMITESGGRIITTCQIPEIGYHALLAELPRDYAQKIIEKAEVNIVMADPVMFIKPSTQASFVGIAETSQESEQKDTFRIINEPIVALFDGMPQENHPLLRGLLQVDDPDNYEEKYQANERVHATSMSSLILRGQSMHVDQTALRQIYVRPIMKGSTTFRGEIIEEVPDDILIVDKIHIAVRRLFEESAGRVAPSIKIINLSIGLRYREFYNIVSPLARLLDWLSFKYRILFIVSAGNHSEDVITDMDFSDYKKMTDEEKDKFVFRYIRSDLRNRRLLSPAESMNALTIGALYEDNSKASTNDRTTNVCSKGMPALYGSFGSGINSAIKPDIFYAGGQNYVHEDYAHRGVLRWNKSSKTAPGIQSAAPGIYAGSISTAFSSGTSNATALITNKAAECYEILNDVFMTETGNSVPDAYAAVLLNAMLVHGASWGNKMPFIQDTLGLNGNQAKNTIHRYFGYGVPDIERVKECTKEQITLIGYGEIKQESAFVYSLPIPIEFHEHKYFRRLVLTLAYFSPIWPSSLKYREQMVWMTIDNGSTLIGSRKEYDYHAVTRGTVQHEIFESDSIQPWDTNDAIEIKVNCKADASNIHPNLLVPYALFATFEMAPEYGIDVYQRVVDKVRIKNVALTKAD